MNDSSAITCQFGTRPRGRGPAACSSLFGTPQAIAPHFDTMALPEQKTAINLMREGGASDSAIAKALGRTEGMVAAIAVIRCVPIRSAMESEAPDGRARSGLLARPVTKAATARALDDALRTVDALRAKSGAAPGAGFEMTLDELCQVCGFGLETARRRIRDLTSRKWLRRTLRPGQPALVTITLVGRCRLDALAGGKGRAEP